jgi:hypothetical protein
VRLASCIDHLGQRGCNERIAFTSGVLVDQCRPGACVTIIAMSSRVLAPVAAARVLPVAQVVQPEPFDSDGLRRWDP